MISASLTKQQSLYRTQKIPHGEERHGVHRLCRRRHKLARSIVHTHTAKSSGSPLSTFESPRRNKKEGHFLSFFRFRGKTRLISQLPLARTILDVMQYITERHARTRRSSARCRHSAVFDGSPSVPTPSNTHKTKINNLVLTYMKKKKKTFYLFFFPNLNVYTISISWERKVERRRHLISSLPRKRLYVCVCTTTTCTDLQSGRCKKKKKKTSNKQRIVCARYCR